LSLGYIINLFSLI